MIFLGDLRIHFAEGADICIAGIIRELHAADDDTHLWIARFYLVDDRLEVGFDLIDRDAEEGVVDAELENEDVDLALEMRWQAGQAALGRASARAGIRYFEFQVGGVQFVQEQRGISLAAFEMKAVRQTVAENEDRFHS